MIKLKRFNKVIGKYNEDVKVQYQVDMTDHAYERKTRHGDGADKIISNVEIVESLRKANDEIIDAIINNDINVNTRDRFIVRVKSTGLNIVCGAHKSDNDDAIKITVITCGRFGKEFKNEGNTFTIEI